MPLWEPLIDKRTQARARGGYGLFCSQGCEAAVFGLMQG